MLIDTHAHVGQYFRLYISPLAISQLMGQAGVGYYAVSSTTMCEENYPKVVAELQELVALDGDKVLPVMWVTPEGLKGNIAWFLESGIKWRMLKIHPYLNQTEWMPGGGLLEEAIEIARELRVPLLIHTGNELCCQSGLFEPAVLGNPDINFVLAHGRPLRQAIDMIGKCDNAYADSAFMPIGDMRRIVQAGLSHKLLWGTDMCIPRHFYPDEDMVEYYQRKLNAFRGACSREQFEQVVFRNAKELFKLEIDNGTI